jgi:DNA-binding response OmpR family regulator
MIVDDEPTNLDVLGTILRQASYEVAAFPRGALALAAAPRVMPDLALLDIRMPEMDGYELCRRLKQDERLRMIPVIFLSALSETRDKVLAFEVGAVDYIPKPLSEPEVLARVRTHLTLRQHQLHLEDLVLQRTRELDAAHRRLRIWDEAKTHWIQMLAHELRTPLTGVFGVASSLFDEIPPERDVAELRSDYDLSCRRIVKLIDDATTLATIDVASGSFDSKPILIVDALVSAVASARRRAEDVTFAPRFDRVPTWQTLASPALLDRAIADLLVTAACCTSSGGQVGILVSQTGDHIALDIATQGKKLPADDLDTFFDICEQRTLHKGGADFGLAPALAFRILQLFDGTATVRNGETEGIVIEVRLPLL